MLSFSLKMLLIILLYKYPGLANKKLPKAILNLSGRKKINQNQSLFKIMIWF